MKFSFVLIFIFLIPLQAIGQKKYLVQKGDNLWEIAKDQTNNPYNWSRLWQQTNTAGITSNPNLIYPGMLITLNKEPFDTTSDGNKLCCIEEISQIKKTNQKLDLANYHLKELKTEGIEVDLNVNQSGSFISLKAITNSIIAGLIVFVFANFFLKARIKRLLNRINTQPNSSISGNDEDEDEILIIQALN